MTVSGDTQRAILAELAAGMQEITRLVGLDPESGEIESTVERVRMLAAAGLLAAPATLPHDAAGQITATVHDALCMCQGTSTGITLSGRDQDLIQAAVASLLESWQGTAPAVPAGDAVERLAAALHETYISRPAHDVDDPGSIFWRDLARTALGAVSADDEAAVERVAKAIQVAMIAAPESYERWPVVDTGKLARAALAALREGEK